MSCALCVNLSPTGLDTSVGARVGGEGQRRETQLMVQDGVQDDLEALKRVKRV